MLDHPALIALIGAALLTTMGAMTNNSMNPVNKRSLSSGWRR